MKDDMCLLSSAELHLGWPQEAEIHCHIIQFDSGRNQSLWYGPPTGNRFLSVRFESVHCVLLCLINLNHQSTLRWLILCPTNVAAQRVWRIFNSWEILRSNLCHDTGNSDRNFPCISSVSPRSVAQSIPGPILSTA